MKNIIFFFFLILPLIAQEEDPDTNNETQNTTTGSEFWTADLPGGNYMVRIDKIVSVSNHSYYLDGAVVVTEVNIDTEGASTVRFYQLTPATEYADLNIAGLLGSVVKGIAARQEEFSGVDPTTTVQKKYPVTTHAKTVEYQISTLSQLSRLYRSISTALETGEGQRFRIGKK